MFEETDSVFNTRQFPLQTFLTNPSKLTICLCKIPTVITADLEQNGISGSWILRNICLANKIAEHFVFFTRTLRDNL
jgi:hypothetical protein